MAVDDLPRLERAGLDSTRGSAQTPCCGRCSPALLAGLTPSQKSVVDHRGGPLLVNAGPGSGKTTVVTHRIASLIAEGVRRSAFSG